MESANCRFFLSAVFIPFAGYKIYLFYKKLFKLTEPLMKEKLQKIFKK